MIISWGRVDSMSLSLDGEASNWHENFFIKKFKRKSVQYVFGNFNVEILRQTKNITFTRFLSFPEPYSNPKHKILSSCHFGHTMNGSTKGSADEVFKRVKHPRNISQFLRKIQQIKMDRTEVLHVIENLEINSSRPYFPENAINIHLEQLGGIQETGIFSLGFENLTKHGVEKMELRLLDRGLSTSRPLVTLGQYQSDLIVIHNKSESNALIENHYNIVMEQNQFLEEDNKCITYPTEEFKDYRTCDESFQRKHLQHTTFKPYWAFGHFSNDEPNIITEGVMDAVTHNTVNLLYTGATRSSCLPPCTTTIATTKFRFEKVSDTEGKDSERLNWIVFYLPEEMRVTSTTMKVTTFSQILSDLGGTLGLWLGLGVLQLFQSVVIFKQNAAVKAFKKLMRRNDKPSFELCDM